LSLLHRHRRSWWLLTECLIHRLPDRCLIGGLEQAGLADDKALFQGGENRLDDRWLQQAGLLPLAHPNLGQRGHRPDLAGNRHHHRSGFASWYAGLLITIAGRLFEAL
jgi:hypothetical protein